MTFLLKRPTAAILSIMLMAMMSVAVVVVDLLALEVFPSGFLVAAKEVRQKKRTELFYTA
jgi:hypothetical protein